MNRKISSKFLMLTLAVGVFGMISANSVWGADAPTSTQIDNIAPSFTVAPSDNSSDGTTPTNVGDDVTFTATASDPNTDDYYLAICKTDAVTAGSSAAPTCDGGAWAVSTATADDAQATVTYTALVGDAESNAWYAFVCDGNGTPGLCSSSSTGDAPFKVNHAGTFGSVTITDAGSGTIEPGDTLLFTLPSANIADPDTDTAQDTITMHVCTEATTAYDYSANSCTGGTSICDSSAVNPTTTAASCSGGASLVSVPTAHGSYDFKVYAEDGHDFAATGTNTQSYTVQDVAPVLTNYSTSDSLTIVADSSDDLTYSVTFTDDNGDNDPTALDFVFFEDTGTSDACTSNENDCYRFDNENLASPANCTVTNRSTAGSGKTATGTDNSLSVTCDFTVWFNATASTNWEVSATATDGLGDTNFADSAQDNTVAALAAIGVVEAGINYGTVAVGGNSAVQTTSMENLGNQILDVLLQGTNMTSGGYSIAASQQHWHPTSSSFTYGSGDFALVTSASTGDESVGCLNRDMAVRLVHNNSDEDEAIYWMIAIPAAQESGSYTGTNTFSTTSSSSCTGTLN